MGRQAGEIHHSGEAMNRRLNSSAVEKSKLSNDSTNLHAVLRRDISTKGGRLGRALAFLVLISTVFKSLATRNAATPSYGSGRRERSPSMGTSAASSEDSRSKDEKESPSILNTLLEQNDSVETHSSDDLVERAATAGQAVFRAEFESKVSSLRGFNSSFKDLVVNSKP
jgi:hypothetical protein